MNLRQPVQGTDNPPVTLVFTIASGILHQGKYTGQQVPAELDRGL